MLPSENHTADVKFISIIHTHQCINAIQNLNVNYYRYLGLALTNKKYVESY